MREAGGKTHPERPQDRADDHHAFHEDAKPGGSEPSIAHPLLSAVSAVIDYDFTALDDDYDIRQVR